MKNSKEWTRELGNRAERIGFLTSPESIQRWVEQIQTDAIKPQEQLEKALADCFMLARRRILAHRRANSQNDDSEAWKHIVQFCEETGQKANILRHTLPTQITDGSPEIGRDSCGSPVLGGIFKDPRNY